MKTRVKVIEGFPPIASGEPRVLILGSMPGEASLKKQEYYGHARNAFWPIMAALFGADTGDSYSKRRAILADNGIAVWDVLQSCQRNGSLDSNITPNTIILNDFASFFERFKSIRRVFFNGGMASAVYRRHILGSLSGKYDYLEYHKLPSTSPAYATLSFAEKLDAWRLIKQPVVK
ncbi:MAG: DNA-deoxyinosine glycosylase [Gammaproteobacteria bacterium]